MPALLPALAAALVVASGEPALAADGALPPTILAPVRGLTDLAAGRAAFVANGPLAVREYRLEGPPRLVVEFDGARVAGAPWRVAPGGGGPIRAGGLYQTAPDVARAVFMVADPTRLAVRIEPVGARHTRIVVAPRGPAEVARAAAGAMGRIEALAFRDGRLEVRGSRPLVARVSPLDGARGYVLEFAGMQLAEAAAAFAVEPGGEVRRVRAVRTAGAAARVELELARAGAYKLRPTAGGWGFEPVRTWRRLPLRAEPAARAAVRLAAALARRPAAPATGAWRAGSHFLVTSNAAGFGTGPVLAGTRHRYGGHFVQPAPALAGTLVGNLDAQLLRFHEPRHDYLNTLGSLALAHPVAAGVHLFEGAAALHRREAYVADATMLDGSLFAGLGYAGAWPAGGYWAASALADRVTATDVRRAYYGQAARLRALLPLGAGVALAGQATFQRLDPVVRSQAFYREYLDLGAEWSPRPGARLGLLVQAGLQQRLGQVEGFVLGGPTCQWLF